MPGIMSGLEPIKSQGVPNLENGGDPRFMSREGFFSYKDDPERLNFRDVADLFLIQMIH